jgi:thioredoxin-related protein
MRKVLLPIVIALFLATSASAQLRMVLNNHLYDENANAKQEIADAIYRAQRENKRVLLVFGANWCYDCHVLDYRFHQPDIQPTLDKSFLVVHVDIGRGEKNVDLTKKYKIPVDRGVPAIAVVDKSGALLYSQQRGEFAPARRLPSRDFLNFLELWAPKG